MEDFYSKTYHNVDIDDYVLTNRAYNSRKNEKIVLDKILIDVLEKYVSYYRIAMNIYCNEVTRFNRAIFTNIGIFTSRYSDDRYEFSDKQYENIYAMTLGNYELYEEEPTFFEYTKILMNCKKLKYISLVIDRYYYDYDLSYNTDLEILHIYFKDFCYYDILTKIPNVKILIIMMKNYTQLNEKNINLPTSLQKLILVKDKNDYKYSGIETMPKIKLPFECKIDYCSIDFKTVIGYY
jgi:hypothetical protein